MKTKLLPTLLAVAIALLAAPAQGQYSAPPESAPRDYSKNSATGEYRRDADQIRTSSLAGTPAATAPAPPASKTTAHAGGFSWGDAGIGAAAGFVLALAGAALVLATRRPAHS